MPFLRKYGTGSGSDVIIPIVKRGVVDFAVSADWTPATGDVKVSKDGGTEANIGTLPVINGTVGWKFVFSDAELQCKSLTVRIVDSATKAVEDQFFVVETYGNASAMFVVDFSMAAFGANTTAPATPTNVTDAKDSVLAKLPAALVSGRMDATVGAYQSGMVPLQPLVAGRQIAVAATTGIVTAELDSASRAAILTQELIESYAADGAAPTVAQALMMLLQHHQQKSVSGTTVTIKKLDKSTTAGTYTLDSATDPTSITRAT